MSTPKNKILRDELRDDETTNASQSSHPFDKRKPARVSTVSNVAREIEEARRLLDKGLSSEAEAMLNAAIIEVGDAQTLICQARCVLSEALELRGRYHEALEAVSIYETPDARGVGTGDLLTTSRAARTCL